MSIATVVTRGYGSFGTIPFVVTAGYSIGSAIGTVFSQALFRQEKTTGVLLLDETEGVFKETISTGRLK